MEALERLKRKKKMIKTNLEFSESEINCIVECIKDKIEYLEVIIKRPDKSISDVSGLESLLKTDFLLDMLLKKLVKILEAKRNYSASLFVKLDKFHFSLAEISVFRNCVLWKIESSKKIKIQKSDGADNKGYAEKQKKLYELESISEKLHKNFLSIQNERGNMSET